jgi:hypothetical protein
VRSDVLGWAFRYWENVDSEIGKRIEEQVRSAAVVPRSAAGGVVISEANTRIPGET